MRVEVLSDHGGEQLQKTEQRFQSAEANRTVWANEHRQTQAELAAVRRDKPFLKKVLGVSTIAENAARVRVQGAWQQVCRADANSQQIHGRRQQQVAGIRGEDILAGGLSVLSDDWVMLRGYRNRRGETDHVLVGPDGIWAVEVKRRKIYLSVDGDHWSYEKRDARGRVVESGDAVDGGGRSWARQVNEVAGELTRWLVRNGYQGQVTTAVMIMHEQAVLVRCEALTVYILGFHPHQLVDAVLSRPHVLTPGACREIVRLVRRDHDYNAKRARRSR